jgi:hypothetical protein
LTLSITFYNNVKYTKDDFMNRDRDFFGNGVVKATDFPLTFPQTSDLTFQVGAGVAWVDGYRIANDATLLQLAVQKGASLPRIDIVQIGHDDLNSQAVVSIKTGVAAASPIEPGPAGGFLKLYSISVPANATTITASAVTDRRTLVPLNISGTQINFSGAASTTSNTFTGTQNAPSFVATSQNAPLSLPNLTALPTNVPIAGTVCVVNGKWYQSNGTAWSPMTDPVATTGTLGSVKVGAGLTVAADGTIAASPSSVGAVNKTGDTMTGNLNAPTLTSTVATGTAPLTVTSTTKVTNLNADQIDNYHAGNASGQVPVSNGTVNATLNADQVDGYHAGNAAGQVPVSNGTVNATLNADQVDGYHAGNTTGQVPVSNGTINTSLNADMVDGYNAGNQAGQVAVNNGMLNASLNADLLDGLHADSLIGQQIQNTAPSNDLYMFVATLPMSGTTTFDKLVVEVEGGPSYGSDTLTYDEVLMGNHGGFAYQYLQKGVDPNSTRSNFRILAYSQTDGSVNVYLRAAKGVNTAVMARAYGINVGNSASTTAIVLGAVSTTVPTGTVVFDSSTAVANMSVTGGTLTGSSLTATSQTAPLKLPNLSALPTVGAVGTICVVNNLWYQSNGTAWVKMTPALQPATTTSLGSVKAGAGINVAADGTIDINSTVLDPFRMDQLNFINLALEVETMKRASLNGVTANIFIESFVDLNDISLLHGTYDSTNQKVYLA